MLTFFCPHLCALLASKLIGNNYHICWQVISDSVIANITKALLHLQFLALSYCFGDISSTGFTLRMPNLRNLKLERVTPWMTNRELATLGENCACLIKLSLVGCPLLNSGANLSYKQTWIMRYQFRTSFSECQHKSQLFSFFDIFFVESQDIISSCWPGLTSLHLEVCCHQFLPSYFCSLQLDLFQLLKL